MKANDYAQMCALINAACEYYGKPSLSDNALRLYFSGLNGLSIEQVRVGLSAHMGNPDCGQYMPKVADIIRGVSGDSEAMADQAWAKVMAAIGSVGRYRSTAFDDAVIHVVISALGGWAKLCAYDYEEIKWVGKDFVRMYRGYLGKPLPDYPRHLPGICEIDNAARGYESEPPVLIGNRSLALEVMRGGADRPAIATSPLRISERIAALGLEIKAGNDGEAA